MEGLQMWLATDELQDEGLEARSTSWGPPMKCLWTELPRSTSFYLKQYPKVHGPRFRLSKGDLVEACLIEGPRRRETPGGALEASRGLEQLPLVAATPLHPAITPSLKGGMGSFNYSGPRKRASFSRRPTHQARSR
jgi:hypothetical protein